MNVTADFIIAAAAPATSKATKGDRTWDFETDTGNFSFCNSYAHFDETQADGCAGTGGMWFGTNDWDCPGYGNNWSDFTWVEVALNTASGPEISLTHKYDLESGYDYAYIEVRPAGDLTYDWVQIATYNGIGACASNTYTIPQAVLDDADNLGVALVDIRFRMTSDGAWSAEDGDYCGFGWWIDEISVSQTAAVTAVDDLPAMGDVAHLNAANPNPFNPSTVLKYHVPNGARQVKLVVFDQRGRQVRELVAESVSGWHEVSWDGRSGQGQQMASGLYFARLMVDGKASVQKMALVK